MLIQRMLRAARLDPDLYYELERDRSANGQAFIVVLIGLACAVLGAGGLRGLLNLIAPWGWGHLIEVLAMSIGDWLFWAYIAVLVGERFGSRADFEQVMRPVGFAYTPEVLWLLAFFPALAYPLGWVIFLWVSIGKIFAVRESMRLSIGKAVLTAFLATVIMAAIDAVFCWISGQAVSLTSIILAPLGR
jgi:Yip1 domain